MIRPLSILGAALLAALPLPGLAAGDPAKPSAAKDAKDGKQREKLLREALAKLPPDQRQQVLAALKHVWADEDVAAARTALKQAAEAYKKEVREAIEQTAPEVQPLIRPLVEKLGTNGWKAGDGTAPKKKESIRYLQMLGVDPAKLTDDERRLLGTVREAVTSDARVKELVQAVKKAGDEPARESARRTLAPAARQVAVAKDAQLQAVFDRFPAAQ